MTVSSRAPVNRPLTPDRLALLTKVARMYHERGLRQPEIAEQLNLSQSRVSRLLRDAVTVGIVRTVVVAPAGVHTDLEDRVRSAFGLKDVVVVDTPAEPGEDALLAALGSGGAGYLELSLGSEERVGISSWSSSLLAVVNSMSPRTTRMAAEVVQILGGVGNPNAQVRATHLADGLAKVTGSRVVYLPLPGIVSSGQVRDALLTDAYTGDAPRLWGSLTTALVGIGSLQPSELLRSSGNAVSDADQAMLRAGGAVGDVCLRFFDANGRHVVSDLEDRVIGISAEQLRATPRRVGVAGGRRKHQAILAAVRGGWLNVLVTDEETAEYLLASLDAPAES
jgi:DNA-binding transcriptional regulator LsrR (DeoR family)